MTDLTSLIDRVRSGSGADRELDGRIALLAGWKHHFGDGGYVPDWPIMGGHWLPPEADGDTFVCSCDTDELFDEPPEYTSSLDAVVRLVEEKLPGWSWQVGPFSKVRAQLAQPVETDFGPGIGLRADETAATPVRALLAALLLALQAQEAS